MKEIFTVPLMMKLYLPLMLVLMGCSSGTPIEHRSIAVLYDRTSKDIQTPDVNAITMEMGLENNPNHEVHFRYLNLGNTRFLKIEELQLDANPSVIANEIERMAAVKQFDEKVQVLIQKQMALDYEFKNSALLAPLLETLHLIQSDHADTKVILMYSDLEEHTDHFSIYRKNDWDLVINNPAQAAQHLSSELELSDFTGITLRVIHYPKDMESDRRFHALLNLYKELFKNTGLTIKYNSER